MRLLAYTSCKSARVSTQGSKLTQRDVYAQWEYVEDRNQELHETFRGCGKTPNGSPEAAAKSKSVGPQ